MKTWRPRLGPTLLILVLLPSMIALGFWQLSRGAQKQQMLDQWALHRQAPTITPSELPDLADPAFRRVILHGEFDGQHSLLLDNRTRDGKAGVELLQPFHDRDSGLWLLVNRGWLPWPDRRIPPVFSTPAHPLTLSASVYVAPGTSFQLQADSASTQWPQLVTALNPPALWAQLERQGFARELRLEPGPEAYRLDWPVVSLSPEKHLGYAVQWFAMSAALVVLYLYLGWHDYKKEKPHERGTQTVDRP